MSESVRYWLGLGAALLLLNFALSFHNIWPTPWITMWPEISMEAAALVFILGVYYRFFGRPSDRFLAGVSCILLIMVLGRYMEVTAPALYGRGINLYWDARYLPAVVAMLAGAAPLYVTILAVVGVAGLLGLVFWLLDWALKRVRGALDRPRTARFLKPVAGAIAALYLVSYYASLPPLSLFSIPVSQTYTRQLGFVFNAISGESAVAALPQESPLSDITADDLPGHDVIVTFVESYGAVAYDDSIAPVLGGPRSGLATAIEATERQVASAFIVAPTFGGGSWLSHSSFMSGLNIDDPASYDALLTQSRPTLPKIFSAGGFRTLALMPGLKNEWPEGSFYGFDMIYGESRLEYSGPEFGWWRIPDQFALARLDEVELGPGSRAPVFLFFPTISTHMPFRPTPPYQPDWQRIASAVPYAAEDLGDSLRQSPEWTNLRPAYADAIAYTYDYWGGYLRSHAEQDFLLVLLGDHQPPASVSGEGARWDVPIHVVTRDAALMDRLLGAGFVRGLTPDDAPVAAMHEIGPLLLK